MDEFRKQFVRKAIVMQIGGFRPSRSLTASWFGQVAVKASGEDWPMHGGKPMLPLAQINLTQLPFRTPGLEDMDLISVFVSSQKLPLQNDPNGSSWVLRTYNTLAGLIPLERPDISFPIKTFQMRPQVIQRDYPCFEDLPPALRKQLWDAYQQNQFENNQGFKLGGWPTLIQSEIDWAPLNKQTSPPEYVFQIDSIEKGNWSWGDAGVGYFGRVAVNGKRHSWVQEWQCF